MESEVVQTKLLGQDAEHTIANESVDLKSHGLSRCEPLTVESIIRGCFSNPNHLSFPKFMSLKCVDSVPLHTQNQDPEYWIGLLKPELIQ